MKDTAEALSHRTLVKTKNDIHLTDRSGGKDTERSNYSETQTFLTRSRRKVPKDLLTDRHFTEKLRMQQSSPEKDTVKNDKLINTNKSLRELIEKTLTYQQKDGPSAHQTLEGHLYNQLKLHYNKASSSKL